MIRNQLLSWFLTVLYSITFFLTSFVLWVPPAQAKCYFVVFCSQRRSNFRSKGGVRRGPCAAEEFESLIALSPESKLKSALAAGEKVGTTIEGYPTVWFYLPPYKFSIQSAKFVLVDDNKHLVQDPVYVQLPVTSDGVIAGLTLPSTGKSLEVGKQYTWYFSILCDSQKPSRNPEVTGQIQRVLPGPQPTAGTPAYLVYDNTYTGQEGLESVVFYDTVTQLIRDRKTYSSDWSNLLSNTEIPSSVDTVELKVLDRPPEKCAPPTISAGDRNPHPVL